MRSQLGRPSVAEKTVLTNNCDGNSTGRDDEKVGFFFFSIYFYW